MRPIICSVVFGHRPWVHADPARDIQRCRCGKVEMARIEVLKWWPRTPRWQRRRWRKFNEVALWGSLRRRQFGSEADRTETWALAQIAEGDRKAERERRAAFLFRAEMRLTAQKPIAHTVISGVTSS